MDHPRSNALCELLVHCGQREAFHVLRTQEQLGYMVGGRCTPFCIMQPRYAPPPPRQPCLMPLHNTEFARTRLRWAVAVCVAGVHTLVRCFKPTHACYAGVLFVVVDHKCQKVYNACLKQLLAQLDSATYQCTRGSGHTSS